MTQQIAALLAQNRHHFFTYCVGHSQELELCCEPDVVIVRSPFLIKTLNFVFSARFSDAMIEGRVADILQLFRANNTPFAWEVESCDETKKLVQALLSIGLTLSHQFVGMYLKLKNWEISEPQHHLVFHSVRTMNQLKEFADMHIYLGEEESFEHLFRYFPIDQQQDSEIVLGVVDGKTVVCGMVFYHGESAGLYYIITKPDYRHQGYGYAMTQHLLQRAKDAGKTLAILHATQEGKNLYQKIGFQPCSLLSEYIHK